MRTDVEPARSNRLRVPLQTTDQLVSRLGVRRHAGVVHDAGLVADDPGVRVRPG
jgi:hypothetical protein